MLKTAVLNISVEAEIFIKKIWIWWIENSKEQHLFKIFYKNVNIF